MPAWRPATRPSKGLKVTNRAANLAGRRAGLEDLPKDPLARCTKRKFLQRNKAVFRLTKDGDAAPFPRAHGTPKEPVSRIRSWTSGSSNGNVLAYAGRVIKDHIGDLAVPRWFYHMLGGRTQDFRRKFKNLELWPKYRVTWIRLQYFLFLRGQAPKWINLLVHISPYVRGAKRVRLSNLPEAIRASCRFIESNSSPGPSRN